MKVPPATRATAYDRPDDSPRSDGVSPAPPEPRGAGRGLNAVDSSVADRTGLRAEPSRTCVGCRGSDSWSALLRVVAATDEDTGNALVTLRPDPRHRRPGRGAWLHPTPKCFELAVRRKAFGRGLRLQAGVDVSAVARHLGIQQP
ncbi:YlxR family protein [Terrabacter sp. 2RAF25]|uniref:YlxR family protein n=1 Tax=Terrabacter sp. 2RAF25 TaxID=3232998 RepID=UPI003F9D6F1C